MSVDGDGAGSPRPVRIGGPLALAALLLTVAAPAGAQEEPRPGVGGARGSVGQPTLTISEAARRALDRHPSVGASRAAHASARARLEEARASRLPTLGVAASGTRFEEPMVVTPIHGFTPGSFPPFDQTLFEGSGSVTWTLWDGGARGGRIDAARHEAGAAGASAEGAEEALLLRVVETYLEALGSARLLDAHDRRLQALEAERERVLDFLDAGRAAEVERYRVEAAVAAARARRVELESALELAERALARLTGLPVERTRVESLSDGSDPSGGVPRADSLYEAAGRTSPELRALRSRVQGAGASVSVARSARWPRVELAGRYVSRGSDDHDFVGEWNAGLQLSVPVYTGGAVGSRISGAEAERDAARERLRAAELELEERVDRAVAAIRERRARRESLEAAVERAEAVVRIERLRLETGTGVQSEYLDAEADLLDARAGLVRARYGELAARARLARAAGALSVDWIERTLGGGP